MSYHYLTSNPSLQSVRFFLQTRFRCKVAPPSRHSLALRAPTSVVRGRAQKMYALARRALLSHEEHCCQCHAGAARPSPGETLSILIALFALHPPAYPNLNQQLPGGISDATTYPGDIGHGGGVPRRG